MLPSQDNIEYGPLKNLIGTWAGGNGVDIAPEPVMKLLFILQ